MICEYEQKNERNTVEGVEISCMRIYIISPRSLQIFLSCSPVRHWQRV